MSSRVYVPPSQDTLFMRGFSYHHRIEDIKDFFAREAGRCMVEFNKDDGSDGQYVALKFESRDVAKDVYRRFNDREILGDRISMTWYKDLRRVKKFNDTRRFNQRGGHYGSDQYDYRNSYQRSGYQKSYYPPASSGRMRKYSRSSSRSRSNTHSLSPSRSRSKSSSKSYDSRDFRKRRSASSSYERHHKASAKKKMKYSKQAGYESSDSLKRQRKLERKMRKSKIDSLISQSLEKTDGKLSEQIATENNEPGMDVEQNQDDNSFERSPISKSNQSAIRSLVQKKADEEKEGEGTADKKDNQANQIESVELDDEDQQIEIPDHPDEITSAGEKNDLGFDLAASDDEELEVEDNIDELSLVSLGFSTTETVKSSAMDTLSLDATEPGVRKDKLSNEAIKTAEKQQAASTSAAGSSWKQAEKLRANLEHQIQQRKETVASLSYEKLKLMREKKKEIEGAFRQDCETVVMVTKMLISKDPELEDRIQNSLKENLREIGHRCIQELREFVDRIKAEEE